MRTWKKGDSVLVPASAESIFHNTRTEDYVTTVIDPDYHADVPGKWVRVGDPHDPERVGPGRIFRPEDLKPVPQAEVVTVRTTSELEPGDVVLNLLPVAIWDADQPVMVTRRIKRPERPTRQGSLVHFKGDRDTTEYILTANGQWVNTSTGYVLPDPDHQFGGEFTVTRVGPRQ